MKDNPVIFITGATGFLGGAVLAHLAQSGLQCRFILLVRGKSEEVCIERVRRSVARFGVEAHAMTKVLRRATVICGDLTDGEWFNNKALDDVTHALHLAANTSFGLNPGVRQTNVAGALIVALSMRHRPYLERYLHVGTSMICGSNPPNVVNEESYPCSGVRHIVPYTAAKAEAESVLESLKLELPLVVVRPSIVVGHTMLGCNPSGSIFWVFRAIDALRKITWSVNSKIDVIPVDYAAAALVHLLLKSELAYCRYHISAGSESSSIWSDIAKAFARGHKNETGDLYQTLEFSAITEDYIERCIGDGPSGRMLRALGLYYQFAETGAVFDNSRLLAELMEAPPAFTSYLKVCLETSLRRTIYDQMSDD